jgi:hypothetical protein
MRLPISVALMLLSVTVAWVPPVHTQPAIGRPPSMRGISYFSFRTGAFGDQTQYPVLDYIQASRANWVQLTTMFFWDPNRRVIHERDGWTDIAALPVAISRIKQRGLKTALYVFVRTDDNDGFAVRPPNDIDEFFRYYSNLVLGHADIAEREGVELLVIANEMNSISGPAYRERWVQLISQVRQRYRGRVTYNAVPNAFIQNVTIADVANLVSFWDQLDVLGFSVYPQLSTSAVPTREEVERGWTQSLYNNSNLLRNLKRWHEVTGKPIVFTEIGYTSADGAAITPGLPRGNQGTPNFALQAMLFDVMFAQVQAEGGSWLEGMFLWTLNTWNRQNDPYLQQIYVDLDYTFFQKPAADVVKRWYSTWADAEAIAARR